MSNEAVRLERGTTPCILYAAKSTRDPRESIRTQLEDGRACAEREGWEIAGEFSDEGFSAFTGSRGPGLEQAKSAAVEVATERGECILVVQHSDRLARGDGLQAPHLVEYALWGIKTGVRIRSIQDQQTFADLLYAAIMGQRNSEDSRRKGASVSDGLRRAAERGKWSGGVLADGYMVIREVDEHGDVHRRVEFDPERKPIYDLIWDLARRGHGSVAITVELDRRGYRTRPRKRTHRPRPFDSNRVRQTLDSPFYAGLAVNRGEVVGQGRWPRYVDPEVFYRLRIERSERSYAGRRRGPGRPPEGYLLARIAVCGECGSAMDTVTGSYTRKDGTRPRRYVCRTHRERPDGCEAMPIDAALVDPAVLDNLRSIFGDLDAIRDGVAAARGSDRRRLESQARTAREEAEQARQGAERIEARVATLYAAGEDEKAVALEDALVQSRIQREAAETRLAATLDAIHAMSGEPDEVGDAGFWERLRVALAERVETARGDVKRLNLALVDFLEAIVISRVEGGAIRLEPRLSGEAVGRILRETRTWTHGVRAQVAGLPAEVVGIDGDASEGREVCLQVEVPAHEAEAWRERILAGDGSVNVGCPPAFEASGGNPQAPW